MKFPIFGRFFLVLFLACSSASAQVQLARLSFEKAQKSYVNKEYTLALLELEQAEKDLGNTNASIVHLRILILNTVVTSSLEQQTQMLAELKTTINYYFNNYTGLADFEKQYQEVMEIAKKIKVEVNREKISQIEHQNKESESKRSGEEKTGIRRSLEFVQMLEEKYNFHRNAGLDGFLSGRPVAQKLFLSTPLKSGDFVYYQTPLKSDTPFPIGAYAARLDKDSQIVYYSEIVNAAKKDFKGLDQEFKNILNTVRSQVSAEYLTLEQDETRIIVAVPSAGEIIQLDYLNAQKWKAIMITFKQEL